MRRAAMLVGFLVSTVLVAAADERRFLFDAQDAVSSRSNKPEAGPPDGTVTLSIDDANEVVLPFTADDFGTMVEDPINLVFLGEADPRNIRAVLLGLDGNRTALGFPDAFPFNCTWRDTTGYNQASYASGRWAAAPIQLECGEYTVLRTHLRLFRHERFTLANAHFELMVPNTADHRVLSWEFAQALVTFDLFRSGVLAGSPESTSPFTPAPSWRTIDFRVFNGVPVSLRGALGLPLADQSADVAIPNDGVASVLRLAGTRPTVALDAERSYRREYNVPIPKPFCSSGPLDYVLLEGPIDIKFHVTVTDEGEYQSEQEATGMLSVTPIDPRTMTPTGPPIEARIRERQNANLSDGTAWGESLVRHTLLGDPEQARFQKLRVGNQERYELDIDCGAN